MRVLIVLLLAGLSCAELLTPWKDNEVIDAPLREVIKREADVSGSGSGSGDETTDTPATDLTTPVPTTESTTESTTDKSTESTTELIMQSTTDVNRAVSLHTASILTLLVLVITTWL